jgi:hypothetical protein
MRTAGRPREPLPKLGVVGSNPIYRSSRKPRIPRGSAPWSPDLRASERAPGTTGGQTSPDLRPVPPLSLFGLVRGRSELEPVHLCAEVLRREVAVDLGGQLGVAVSHDALHRGRVRSGHHEKDRGRNGAGHGSGSVEPRVWATAYFAFMNPGAIRDDIHKGPVRSQLLNKRLTAPLAAYGFTLRRGPSTGPRLLRRPAALLHAGGSAPGGEADQTARGRPAGFACAR